MRRKSRLAACSPALLLAISALLLFPESASAQHAYYIDCAGGSDNNPGTKTSPWQHAPGMPGFSHKGYSHSAGDQVIFQGGVTCPVSYFPWTISNSGMSGTPDYYGVDKTWFTRGAWTRPVFDGGKTGPSGNWVTINGNNVTLDNIEMKNQGVPAGRQYKAIDMEGKNDVVTNFYIHAHYLIGTCSTGDDTANGFFGITLGGSKPQRKSDAWDQLRQQRRSYG